MCQVLIDRSRTVEKPTLISRLNQVGIDGPSAIDMIPISGAFLDGLRRTVHVSPRGPRVVTVPMEIRTAERFQFDSSELFLVKELNISLERQFVQR
jgi:hypothetical protein